jgi:hypothetical protein
MLEVELHTVSLLADTASEHYKMPVSPSFA